MKLRHAMLLLAASASAGAGDKPAKEIISKLAGHKVSIEASFEGPLGLEGFVVKPEAGRPFIVYASPDGKYLFVGSIFDASGLNLTRAALDKLAPGPSLKDLYRDSEKAVWIEEGTGGGILYVVADPLCGYCRKLHKALSPYIKEGKVRVRWIMTGILSPKSKELASRAIAAARTLDGDAIRRLYEGTGLEGVEVDEKARQAVEENLSLVRRYGIHGTPFIIFKTRAGSIQTVGGFVKGERLAAIVASLKGGQS